MVGSSESVANRRRATAERRRDTDRDVAADLVRVGREEEAIHGAAVTGPLVVGEVVSIGVMEIVMNFVDYQMGGMGAPSIASWMFWRGILFAVPAGFIAAWPVNYWLLKRELKACH